MTPKPSVCITGMAGTLGLAFAELLKDDYTVIGMDTNEWGLAQAEAACPEAAYVLGDFADWHLRTDYLIHCAAYKHVDLGQHNPAAFMSTNVVKTEQLFRQCATQGTKFLFISTDKAVEPCSTYGYTKALGEELATFYYGAIARLGNILASHGSVIPVWEAQIAAKQPITITDERMTRYVIRAQGAVAAIWPRFIAGERLIIPAMGEPVRLLDLLAQVLAKHGYASVEEYKPGVVVIGLRPGEKLHEKLRWDHEVGV